MPLLLLPLPLPLPFLGEGEGVGVDVSVDATPLLLLLLPAAFLGEGVGVELVLSLAKDVDGASISVDASSKAQTVFFFGIINLRMLLLTKIWALIAPTLRYTSACTSCLAHNDPPCDLSSLLTIYIPFEEKRARKAVEGLTTRTVRSCTTS